MSLDNPYFLAVLTIVVVLFLVDLVSDLLNLSALKPSLPEFFKDVYDAGKYKTSQDYTRETTKFGFVDHSISLAIFLAFWLLGGFPWLDSIVRSWELSPLLTGLAAVGVLFVANTLAALPFDIYDTFVIEQKYGFNKTTFGTFVVDQLKGLALAAAIGLPVTALVLYLFTRFENAWLYAWLTISGLTLALAYIAPKYILPLFNKFTPLEDGELKSSIHSMAKKCEFPLTEVSVMDGSKRSAKSNAFFTGFGKNKKIALYDTLVEKHTTDELVGVLAHEIGHFKKKHIVQGMAVGILHTGALFFLLSVFLTNPQLFAAFGMPAPGSPPDATTVAFGFIFFGLLFKPINKILSVAMAVLSRKNEFEADAYAASVTGKPLTMVAALKKLAADNLANLTPHPFYVFMTYSHPPMIERLQALEALADDPS